MPRILWSVGSSCGGRHVFLSGLIVVVQDFIDIGKRPMRVEQIRISFDRFAKLTLRLFDEVHVVVTALKLGEQILGFVVMLFSR